MLAWLVLTTGALAADPCPAEADLALARASTYFEQGLYTEARLATAAVHTLCPQSVDAMYLSFGLAAWVDHDDRRSRAWLDRMLAIDACESRALGWRAILNDRVDPEASRADAVQAVVCNPDHTGAWSALARSQRHLDAPIFRPVVGPKARVRSDEAEWQAHLSVAREAGLEQAALYAHALADDQRDAYAAWRTANPGQMAHYLNTLVAPVPDAVELPTQ